MKRFGLNPDLALSPSKRKALTQLCRDQLYDLRSGDFRRTAKARHALLQLGFDRELVAGAISANLTDQDIAETMVSRVRLPLTPQEG